MTSLKHFGIPGMKWGVRNDPKTQPSARTSAAKKAADKAWDKLLEADDHFSRNQKSKAAADAFDKADKEYNIAQKKYKNSQALDKMSPRTIKSKAAADKAWKDLMNIDTEFSLDPQNKTKAKFFDDANKKYYEAQKAYNNSKLLDKIDSKPKSEYRMKLEAKYKEKGASNEEAAIKAYKHERTEKILVGLGAVALTAGVVGLAAYKTKKSIDFVNEAFKEKGKPDKNIKFAFDVVKKNGERLVKFGSLTGEEADYKAVANAFKDFLAN